MLYLVVALGLVVILMDWARKPEHWRWFEALSEPRDETPADPRLPSGALPEVPGVNRQYLTEVRDDTPTRRAERDAWFELWDVLLRLSPDDLRKFSVGRVSYVQLMGQSNLYRGKLVRLQGTIRRIERIAAPDNAVGIKHYYEAWLSPRDNPSSPILVYVLNLPKKFPAGKDLAEDVALVGFFFKRYVYLAGDPAAKTDALRTAPVVLAKELQWKPPPPPVAERPPGAATVTIVLVAAIGASLLFIWFVYSRTRRPRRDEHEPSVSRAIPGSDPDEENGGHSQ
ncbi:MAG: hypothetical protein JXB10_10080 [Pirellulales bacterium]|nr:hypothetical protein [Pirellulales bacterium]